MTSRQRRQRKAKLDSLFLGVCSTYTVCLVVTFLTLAFAHIFSIL
jgi:hypothetical protein